MSLYSIDLWPLGSSAKYHTAHKETSWEKTRIGLSDGKNGSVKLKLEDIRNDAGKVRPYDTVWDMYYDEFDDAQEV